MRCVGALYGKGRTYALLRLPRQNRRIKHIGYVWVFSSIEVNAMRMFYVINQHGLRFMLRADTRKEACQTLMRMLGKSSLPNYLMVISVV